MNQQTASANNQQSSATDHNLGKGGAVQFKAQSPVGKLANDTGLPLQLKSGIEQLSGFSLNDVKVHYNSAEPAQLQAHAFARGTDIHVASGQEKHLAHEAWHVVQQKQGRVKPTTQLKGNAINDDVSLETEADVMGAKAAAVQPFTTQLRAAKTGANTPVIQGKWLRMMGLTMEDQEGQKIAELISGEHFLSALALLTKNNPEHFEKVGHILDYVETDQEAYLLFGDILEETYKDQANNYSTNELLDLLLEKIPEGRGYNDIADGALKENGASDSAEEDLSDHPEGADADYEPIFPEDLEPAEFENIEDHNSILLEIFKNMLVLHQIDIQKREIWEHFFAKWKTGVHTRSFWSRLKAELQRGQSVEQVAQLARTPNTESYQASYKTKNFGTFKKVAYMRDNKGNINFTKPKNKGGMVWKNPVKASSLVPLNKGMKGANKQYGITSGGQKVKIADASRSQHFSIGDKLYPWAKNNRKAAWTWHHLTNKYDMVLVDMAVHAKHGHNGGFLLW